MAIFIGNQCLKSFLVGTIFLLTACAIAPERDLPFTGQTAKVSSSEQLFNAVLGVIATVPETARTAETLGTHRLGSGVLIDHNGLILTIDYLIMEAKSVAVIGPDGERIAADIVAVDPETGFGLLRARDPIDAAPLVLGTSENLKEGTPVLAVSHGGRIAALAAHIVSLRPFAGYGEYLVDAAIFTIPPLREYGGAALIDSRGRLIGIGSLMVNDAVLMDRPVSGNMFVPVDLLRPLIGDLVTNGRRTSPGAPWLGVRIDEAQGRVFITSVSADAPGEKAGLMPGDVIIGVNGRRIRSMEDYLRKVRGHGRAGDDIPLDIVPRATHDLIIKRVVVSSMNRSDWLRSIKR